MVLFNYLLRSMVMPDLNSNINLSSKTLIFEINLLTICSSYSVTRPVCVSRNSFIYAIRFCMASYSAPLERMRAFRSLKISICFVIESYFSLSFTLMTSFSWSQAMHLSISASSSDPSSRRTSSIFFCSCIKASSLPPRVLLMALITAF